MAPERAPAVRVDGREWGAEEGAKAAVAAAAVAVAQPIERAIKSDPCAARLHEISGALLEYYALQGRLPKRLEELQALAEAGRPLELSCPTTGQPYVSVPAGLRGADDGGRTVVVHDATPDAGGGRWAILMQRPRGGQAGAMWVVFLTDAAFRGYGAATMPASGPTTAKP